MVSFVVVEVVVHGRRGVTVTGEGGEVFSNTNEGEFSRLLL